ncbi:hypothetical protein N0V94_008363 [Neodidymelliopsis sp. IMI 364377]|nr:hypothetical protein N0V94_008363 [Neodidymelliopsis sp. IMI 364377]
MSRQPRSIFTGATPSPTSPDDRRVSAHGHRHKAANPPPEGLQPPTLLEENYSALFPTPQASWTVRPPRDIFHASTPRPSSAPSSGAEAFDAPHLATTPPPALAGTKRLAPRIRDDAPATEPLHKRRRLQPRARHSLDLRRYAQCPPLLYDGQPPSPLFFSSKPARPHLPARFSSSEAAARMLSKTRGEDGSIKTVTLARGTFSGLSPPGLTSVTSGRSSERSSIPRTSSPDARERSDPLKLLSSVSIVELLEYDTRPTFIVDVADHSPYAHESSSLQILFANNALRSNATTWETVAGRPTEQSPDEALTHATNQFRGWLQGNGTLGEECDTSQSPVEHGGMVWSWYTLRKRLRIVSGVTPSASIGGIPSTSASVNFAIPSSSPAGQLSGRTLDTASSSAKAGEQQDYFGPPAVTKEPSNALTSYTRQHLSDTVHDDPASKSTHLTLPSIEDTVSFTNECVLRAHSAGDVDSFHREPKAPQDHDMGFFDWTRLSLSPSLPRHIQFARAVDWASTPLGPIEYWSNDLRAMCNLIM